MMSFKNNSLRLYSLKIPNSLKQQGFKVTSHRMYLAWIVTFSKELQESPNKKIECQVTEDMPLGKVRVQQKNSIKKWRKISKHLKGIILVMFSTTIPITLMLLIIEHIEKAINLKLHFYTSFYQKMMFFSLIIVPKILLFIFLKEKASFNCFYSKFLIILVFLVRFLSVF